MNKITHAKLTKGRTVEVDLTEILDDHTENEVTKKCSQLAHEDLIKAFRRLKVHFVKLLDLYEGRSLAVNEDEAASDILTKLYDPENDLENFEVMSFSIGGSDDNEGVTLSGMKKLSSGKVINFNTPFLKYSDEEEYRHASELAADIQQVIFEVEEYLNGKYAVKQLELPFGEEGEFEVSKTGENEITVKVGKGKGRKKGGKTVYMTPVDEKPAFAEM